MEVNKYIRELLIGHNCVILPGLGGFVANYKSAQIDFTSRSIYPPSKVLFFNNQLKHNDGLLIGHLSKRLGIPYEKAEEIINSYINNIETSIASGKKFVIDELGYLYADQKHGLLFQEESGINLLTDSYGLSFIHYKDIDKDRPKSEQQKMRGISDRKVASRNKKVRQWIYVGTAASIITAMILIPTRTGLVDRNNFNLSSIDGFRKKNSAVSTVSESASPGKISSEQKTIQQSTTLQGVNNRVYHIIAGSFRNFGNARMMRLDMIEKGFGARILAGQNGLFRVSIRTFEDKNKAVEALNEIKMEESLSQAWILSD